MNVILGLDPHIYPFARMAFRAMDRRVKPGGDASRECQPHQRDGWRKAVNCPRTIGRMVNPCLSFFFVAVMLASAAAQGLSNRPITIVVPYSPGTGPDVMARVVGEGLQTRWSQAVVIDNKPGATGNIGTQMVARATPD